MFRSFLGLFVVEPLKRLGRLFTDSRYRTFWKLRLQIGYRPRYERCDITLGDWHLQIPDSASFLSAYEEIFVNRSYEFQTISQKPYILDAGSNIGVSILFFKSIFPEADIVAFEADPIIFKFLSTNLNDNGFNDVKIINKAVWHEESLLKFKADGADGGRIVIDSDDTGLVEVETIDLKPYLIGKKVDFLKMDIEGAETDVLFHCSQYLSNIENIFIEYHNTAGNKRRLGELLGLLENNGFHYHMHLHPALNINVPFLNKSSSFHNYDMLLNIFAWRVNN